MPGLRPATPGFIVTLTATVLLALVSFNTPIIKSIDFIQASLTIDNVNGTISLGTLGYCLELSTNGTTCSSPRVGYSFDPNALLGDNVKFAQIPTVVVKWITYALFLHVIALCGAAISAFFGLLAHVREMSMACCSTCISGFAAVIALVAFIFDIVLFFVVKARVKDIGGTASFGSAVWLTLAAWLLLFFSGCFFAFGRCCMRRRPRDGRMDNTWMNRFPGNANSDHAEQMRLDAVKAEADRKARQKNEVGLPAFPEHSDIVRPLKNIDDESDEDVPYRDHAAVPAGPRRQGSASTTGQTFRGGYAQAAPGTRAVDEYYASSSSPAPSNVGGNTGYPPNRQYSTSTSGPQSVYNYNSTAPGGGGGATVAAATTAAGGAAGYLAAGGHNQYPSAAATYGHGNGGTTYHTAASSQHQQYPSAYSQYADPYPQTHAQQPSTGAAAYASPYGGNSANSATPPPPTRQTSQPYADPYSAYSTSPGQQQDSNYNSNYNAAYGTHDLYGSSSNNVYASPVQQQQQQHAPERSYTLGGGGYGGNVVPDASSGSPRAGAYGVPALTTSPPPMPSASPNLNVSSVGMGARGSSSPSPNHGQRAPVREGSYEDSPPGYESNAAASVYVPAWGAKGV